VAHGDVDLNHLPEIRSSLGGRNNLGRAGRTMSQRQRSVESFLRRVVPWKIHARARLHQCGIRVGRSIRHLQVIEIVRSYPLQDRQLLCSRHELKVQVRREMSRSQNKSFCRAGQRCAELRSTGIVLR